MTEKAVLIDELITVREQFRTLAEKANTIGYARKELTGIDFLTVNEKKEIHHALDAALIVLRKRVVVLNKRERDLEEIVEPYKIGLF